MRWRKERIKEKELTDNTMTTTINQNKQTNLSLLLLVSPPHLSLPLHHTSVPVLSATSLPASLCRSVPCPRQPTFVSSASVLQEGDDELPLGLTGSIRPLSVGFSEKKKRNDESFELGKGQKRMTEMRQGNGILWHDAVCLQSTQKRKKQLELSSGCIRCSLNFSSWT